LGSLLKTTLTIITAFVVVFSGLFFFVNSYANFSPHNNDVIFLENSNDDFYSKNLGEEKNKIFLIGSSQIGRLNETQIQEYLYENNKNFEIYNLATSADTPKQRLKSIDNAIALRPDLVIYGIGYRDFADILLLSALDKPESFLPDPEKSFDDIIISLENSVNYDFDRIKSPKIVTIASIKQKLNEDEKIDEGNLIRPNTPFYRTDQSNTLILNDFELKRAISASPFKLDKIESPEINENVKALREIIRKLQDNKIDIIIFSMPYTQHYLDTIPEEDKLLFESILKKLSDEYGIPLYFLHEKYTESEIWNGNDHVAVGKLVINDDIAKLILNEMES